MTVLLEIILIVAGVSCGIVIGYAVGHFKGEAANGYAKELMEILERNEKELVATREFVVDACKTLEG
jgi:hypothetical protein